MRFLLFFSLFMLKYNKLLLFYFIVYDLFWVGHIDSDRPPQNDLFLFKIFPIHENYHFVDHKISQLQVYLTILCNPLLTINEFNFTSFFFLAY